MQNTYKLQARSRCAWYTWLFIQIMRSNFLRRKHSVLSTKFNRIFIVLSLFQFLSSYALARRKLQQTKILIFLRASRPGDAEWNMEAPRD